MKYDEISPAPWSHEGAYLIAANKDIVAVMWNHGRGPANIRVAALAPELTDLAWEVAHHLYDKQDMERCRATALGLLKKLEIKE